MDDGILKKIKDIEGIESKNTINAQKKAEREVANEAIRSQSNITFGDYYEKYLESKLNSYKQFCGNSDIGCEIKMLANCALLEVTDKKISNDIFNSIYFGLYISQFPFSDEDCSNQPTIITISSHGIPLKYYNKAQFKNGKLSAADYDEGIVDVSQINELNSFNEGLIDEAFKVFLNAYLNFLADYLKQE
jgi:hypothetical protein